MEEPSEHSPDSASVTVPESPRPTAFTIDFGDDKKVDIQRQKTLAEKFQQRHKRGKSMSKLEDNNLTPSSATAKKHPLSANLPRKSSFQSEDEKAERNKSAKANSKRGDLTLHLKNITSERMTQSFPNAALPSLADPEPCEIQNVSSPEFELISPFSPNISQELISPIDKITLSSEESIQQDNDEVFSKTFDCDIDKKSDNVSEAGTYTVDVDHYSEEQKARMSIDNEFKIEQVSVQKKTEEYIRSLSNTKTLNDEAVKIAPRPFLEEAIAEMKSSNEKTKYMTLPLKSPTASSAKPFPVKVLSPILSPTQNLSLVETNRVTSSPKNQRATAKSTDAGTIISVTSSGVFRIKTEEERRLERKLSLSKSDIQVEAYVDGRSYNERKMNNAKSNVYRPNNLTANIVNVQSIEMIGGDTGGVVSASLVFGKMGGAVTASSGLPPTPTGKTSPSKIPSPIHSLSRPRSRNSLSAVSDDLDTEFILKPTQNYINTLQHKLSLDSDQDSDYELKYGLQLNNTAHLMKQKASHIRHNSLDDKAINNKLEHFQNKNLQSIDQTYSNLLNQYKQNKVVNKINNSPSNSPIRRSSSFSNRNQINQTKSTNLNSLQQKESNLCGSPSLGKNGIQNNIQRSSSTACIKPNYGTNGKRVEHRKIDRNQFGDTESSSEEDFDKELHKRKDLGNISNTRCNRTFSLRRARLDNEATKLKCPNTPEMRRKSFQPESKPERAISVDRKSIKTNEVQSRYLLNISKRATPPPVSKAPPKASSSAVSKNMVKPGAGFCRMDSGRLSIRNLKPPNTTVSTKPTKKDGKNSKQSSGGRSNSSLSSREVEFQNWKRRKSYDPMKAAAEGKKKEMQKKITEMTGSYTEASGRPGHSPDSSPSHSGSVHRSQSFHGTAALEQLISSDEEDMTLSADEGLSPPTPSPCELSPTRASLRHALWERIRN
ncbi:uncharacterized protein LOC143198016 isoform X2 [Rhynchophorus ferrugineus]|uniref:Uncharacterized protein n=1 Tax=Rhynchophorus ferrugineus TaxID=354439 RepID=A0A834MDZ3_RHYFE|nr:hypothetical protein GWI33_005209 [Rhynchophorus ferrugineus]